MGTSLACREKSLYASLAAELLVYGPYATVSHFQLDSRGYHQDRYADCDLPESPLMPAIRNKIRELRAMREMTQQDLADRVGVTRQTVIAIEQDKYSPSLETAFKVAIVLGVPLDQCFQYDPHGKR